MESVKRVKMRRIVEMLQDDAIFDKVEVAIAGWPTVPVVELRLW